MSETESAAPPTETLLPPFVVAVSVTVVWLIDVIERVVSAVKPV